MYVPMIPDDTINLTGKLPDPYIGLSPRQLDDERGRLHMLVVDALTEQDRAYWQAQLDDVDRRIARYKRHGVAWPDARQRDALRDFARDLKAAIDLPRFIDDMILTTHLTRAGDRWRGSCPLPDHDDATPSFVVYPDGGWYCFGKCQRGGDVFTLVALAFGVESFREQVRIAADYLGRGSEGEHERA